MGLAAAAGNVGAVVWAGRTGAGLGELGEVVTAGLFGWAATLGVWAQAAKVSSSKPQLA